MEGTCNDVESLVKNVAPEQRALNRRYSVMVQLLEPIIQAALKNRYQRGRREGLRLGVLMGFSFGITTGALFLWLAIYVMR